MNNFSIYFNIGFNHIANLGAMDHLLFMMALTLRYQFADWKKLLVLITAFTIGHAISLTLCILEIVDFSKNWIEFLIPVTIAITALSNVFDKTNSYKSKFSFIYWMALIFGLVHGLGFSNDLKMIIGDKGIALKLFAANLGIEATQIIFVLGLLIIQFICNKLLKINSRDYLLFISGVLFGIGIFIASQRLPF